MRYRVSMMIQVYVEAMNRIDAEHLAWREKERLVKARESVVTAVMHTVEDPPAAPSRDQP